MDSTLYIRRNDLKQTLENMKSLPNLVPWARMLSVIMAVFLGILVVLQIATGIISGMTSGGIIASVVVLVLTLLLEFFLAIYGINCAAIGASEKNNCGLYSRVNAYILGVVFMLLIIISSAVLLNTVFGKVGTRERLTNQAVPPTGTDSQQVSNTQQRKKKQMDQATSSGPRPIDD